MGRATGKAAGGCGIAIAPEGSSIRKPHEPQKRKPGGTSLPHEGQRRAALGGGAAKPGEKPGTPGGGPMAGPIAAGGLVTNGPEGGIPGMAPRIAGGVLAPARGAGAAWPVCPAFSAIIVFIIPTSCRADSSAPHPKQNLKLS